ncbi:MAG: hypothetical protein ACSHXK_06605 [Oceanococcus sp.]
MLHSFEQGLALDAKLSIRIAIKCPDMFGATGIGSGEYNPLRNAKPYADGQRLNP